MTCAATATAKAMQIANRKSMFPTRIQYRIHGRKPSTKPIATPSRDHTNTNTNTDATSGDDRHRDRAARRPSVPGARRR
jgi:hypothetical protein